MEGGTTARTPYTPEHFDEAVDVREGAVPARLIETSENLEAEMVGVDVRGPYAPVIGRSEKAGCTGRPQGGAP